MPYDFVLPDLGEGITEGEIRKWLVKEGDHVQEHQSVLEVETDKAVVEVPSPRKGRVLKIARQEGEMVNVGEVLMSIAEPAEEAEGKPEGAAPVAEAKGAKKEEAGKRESVSVVGVLPEEPERPGEKEKPAKPGRPEVREKAAEVLAAPAVRALARELGVDLGGLSGSGPGGSITIEDVKEEAGGGKAVKPGAAARPGARDSYGPTERIPVRGLRRSIAKNLLTVLRTYAPVTGMEDADVTDLWELREREKGALRKQGVHLTFVPFFIKAVQHALVSHPLLNASLDGEADEIVVKKYYNLGIATDTPDGLMVPVIKDVDRKTILELASELHEITRRARDRKLRLDELKGNSFTISNYGSVGGTYATPIINYPDSAILGAGRIAERPWVRDGKIVIRKILHLSLTFDHRVTDGADAAQFLTKVKRYLEDPALIFIESS
jgi:pyruvate dehydrogenase E2 component (dihydrolipoamide acetyltransferase)